MYKVIYKFRDLQDSTKHEYKKDDKFPFDDREISEDRIKELSSDSNLIGRILIEVDENSASTESNTEAGQLNSTAAAKSADNKENLTKATVSSKAKAKAKPNTKSKNK